MNATLPIGPVPECWRSFDFIPPLPSVENDQKVGEILSMAVIADGNAV